MYRFKIDLVDERARDSDDWRMSVQTHAGKILRKLLLISHPTTTGNADLGGSLESGAKYRVIPDAPSPTC